MSLEEEQPIRIGPSHPLHQIKPDAWKNIPLPVVSAIKQMLEEIVQSDSKMKQLLNKFEFLKERMTQMQQRSDKEHVKLKEEIWGQVVEYNKDTRNKMQGRIMDLVSANDFLKVTVENFNQFHTDQGSYIIKKLHSFDRELNGLKALESEFKDYQTNLN